MGRPIRPIERKARIYNCIHNSCRNYRHTNRNYKQMNQKKQTGYETFPTYSICHTEVWQMLLARARYR